MSSSSLVDSKNMDDKFVSPVCSHCNQTTQYDLGVDRGTVDILKAIATKIRLKGENAVHPRNEMEVSVREHLDYKDMVTMGVLTSNQINNLSRARYHGLIAKIDDRPGFYCLTQKGERFLAGEAIPRTAIIDKAKKMTIGYWHEERISPPWWVTIKDFKPDQEYWEGMKFTISAGKVVPRQEETARLF